MKQAHIHLVKYSLAHGMVISVYDGEEWAVKRSSSYKDIMDAINSVEESQLRIRDPKKEGSHGGMCDVIGWALIIPELEPDETVVDYTTTEFMLKWDLVYEEEKGK